MPKIVTLGDMSSGHDACGPVPAVTGSEIFFVNNKNVVRVGDKYAPHGCIWHPTHSGVVTSGSSIVFSEGKAVALVGSSISCGDTSAQGDDLIEISN